MNRRPGLALLAALAAPSLVAAAPVKPEPYSLTPGRTCDGYPRVDIGTRAGACAGLIVAPAAGQFAARQIRAPRSLLPLAGGDWLVVDLGGWGRQAGAVWRLTPKPQGAVVRRLLGDLVMPHGVALGPDGKVYVGEMTRIFRFNPDAADPAASVEAVVSGLPENRLHDNRHPLSAFLFDADGSLLVNVGAPTDGCTDAAGKRDGEQACAEADKGQAAAIWRYAYLGDGRWAAKPEVFATGLRNSVALVRHASGALLQGENSYDFDDPAEPYDEINLLRPGGFYGWPYCFDRQGVTPAWKGAFDCGSPRHRRPIALLPPHAAPISMTYYDGPMFPELKGRLLMTWRGFRKPAARVVAVAVDGQGLPVTRAGARYAVYPSAAPGSRAYDKAAGRGVDALVLTTAWDSKPGSRPRGAPAGLAVAADGAIWVTDDKNGAIIRLAADRP